MLRAEPHQEVLLYYCYAELSAADRQRLAAFYSADGASNRLAGRGRVARDGVNATLRGSATGALHEE